MKFTSIVDNDLNYIHHSNLNPKYTFENFIVGNTNKFAQRAAVQIAESPGQLYNPLFIYGNSGLGKTHLMFAIGNYIEKHSNKRVLYITSDTFVNEFIDITRKKENKSEKGLKGNKPIRQTEILFIKGLNWMTFQELLSRGEDVSDEEMGFID